MKKIVLLILFTSFIILSANATIHVVQVANFQFSPANLTNVFVGDTVRWNWVSGFHTTTDDPASHSGNSLPVGAAPWDATISSSSKTFDYKVTVAGTYNYWCTPHAPNMAGSFTASAALPIRFSAFTITASGGKAVLNWKTLTEQNTDYFIVRRSLNGSTYTDIARVPASGNSTSEKNYSYIDVNAADAKFYYYNIMTVDKDAKQQFSEVKVIKGGGEQAKLELMLSPNPISRPGHLNLTFSANKEGEMSVSVINSQGQVIINNKMKAFTGVNNGHLHLGNLASGNYTLICVLDGEKESKQIIYK